MSKIIFLIGPPLSGKDTQGKLLAKKLKGKVYATSDLLREFFEKTNKRYLKINNKFFDLYKEKEKITKGLLVSSEIVLKVVLDKINEFLEKKKNLVLAGSPRKLKEAKIEYEFLKNRGVEFKVIYLVVSQKEIFKRALKRKRQDDDLEIVKRRINEFKKDTLPAIEFLKQKGVLIKVNGEGDVLKIHREILKNLKIKSFKRSIAKR